MLTFLYLIIFSLAVFRLTRLFVFDKITEFIRRPFHNEVEEMNENGNVETYIEIKGNGLRAWIGELLSCYWCTGVWCSAFLYGIWLIWPSITEPLLIILAVAGAAGMIETIVTKLLD
ncbi:DUF1360 domain-containing protein [Metabacillus fastidiosus]|uniref:DUF1360 domain-containing protein n=1 Tax=Metabacillus fastidiosus TaxID=1458 RepID=A0ABU6P1J6_9BACI|nr:DUF1360 domain-containing protein [Metabacillus fastidiosus]MED4403236.1 DUF1360 domain-containing protein [Metabacillus fastidiosus]MED4455471.1 DUF1360 domain-containing protein [Metabacillus fastidiosus]MED4461660.1 DUF1360 domain-containing protein [Metabacillus fastidiosus]